MNHLILFMNIWSFSFLRLELLKISIILNPLFLKINQLLQTRPTLMKALTVTIIIIFDSFFNSFAHEEIFIVFKGLFWGFYGSDRFVSFLWTEDIVLIETEIQFLADFDVYLWFLFLLLGIVLLWWIIAEYTMLWKYLLILILVHRFLSLINHYTRHILLIRILTFLYFYQPLELSAKFLIEMCEDRFVTCLADSFFDVHGYPSTEII